MKMMHESRRKLTLPRLRTTLSLRSLLLLVTLLAFGFGLRRQHAPWQLAFEKPGVYDEVRYSPDGRLLAAANVHAQVVEVWDARNGDCA
jgi:hypothetical protein